MNNGRAVDARPQSSHYFIHCSWHQNVNENEKIPSQWRLQWTNDLRLAINFVSILHTKQLYTDVYRTKLVAFGWFTWMTEIIWKEVNKWTDNLDDSSLSTAHNNGEGRTPLRVLYKPTVKFKLFLFVHFHETLAKKSNENPNTSFIFHPRCLLWIAVFKKLVINIGPRFRPGPKF